MSKAEAEKKDSELDPEELKALIEWLNCADSESEEEWLKCIEGL